MGPHTPASAPPRRQPLSWPARLALALGLAALAAAPSGAQDEAAQPWLADRGSGLTTSLFGTFVEAGEMLVYPFYEYTKTSAFEYKASELGYTGDVDYLGELVEHEYLLFLAWGVSERLAIELEGAVYTRATFDKAPDDPTEVPARLEESGLGDVETQVVWRWREETAERPEMYSFAKVVFPLQKSEVLIGTSDWEGELGFGVVRGFRWGTLTGRLALAYDGEDDSGELGEYAVEYLRRVSSSWRFVAALEGESDELSVIGEAQWFPARHVMVKLNCGFGISEKAPDLAPEVGVLFRF